MFWFRKRKEQEQKLCDKEAAVSIAVEHHKQVSKSVLKETKQTTDSFNRLLKKNGITLKIHIATGGHK